MHPRIKDRYISNLHTRKREVQITLQNLVDDLISQLNCLIDQLHYHNSIDGVTVAEKYFEIYSVMLDRLRSVDLQSSEDVEFICSCGPSINDSCQLIVASTLTQLNDEKLNSLRSNSQPI